MTEPMKMEATLATLESHVTEHRLIQRAEQGFRAWIDEAIADGATDLPAGWTYDQLSVQLESISLCFRPVLVSYAYVDTRLTILREDVQVGYYRLITRLDGSDADDYFVITPLDLKDGQAED